jgi:PleD family two-component response regulator
VSKGDHRGKLSNSAGETKTIWGKPAKVLVIHRNESVRNRFLMLLSGLNAELYLAEDEMVGLGMLKWNDYGLIISQSDLPIIHGFDLAKFVNSKEDSRVPVLFIHEKSGEMLLSKTLANQEREMTALEYTDETFMHTVQGLLEYRQ